MAWLKASELPPLNVVARCAVGAEFVGGFRVDVGGGRGGGAENEDGEEERGEHGDDGCEARPFPVGHTLSPRFRELPVRYPFPEWELLNSLLRTGFPCQPAAENPGS